MIKDTVKAIKSLKIQGATNVAKAAVNAVISEVKSKNFRSRDQLIKSLEMYKAMLFGSRPTEPMMRNALRYIVFNVSNSPYEDVKSLKKAVVTYGKDILNLMKRAENAITYIGSNFVPKGATVLTHCHSSTVVSILKSAKKKGIHVICTETRPLYQGRKTAKELVNSKIDTTLVVDSAAGQMMKDADLFIIGADVISSEGSIVNKVGSNSLAVLAKANNTKVYVAATLLKYDPETLYGSNEPIEFRSPKEVWSKPPKGLKIINPAFEVVSKQFIDGIITEYGVIAPENVMEFASLKYPWLYYQKEG
ncbi:MAG TPA: S-methyl-5-thioribose-1-phosphate isomerase [Candidatus Aenigmarchaeota archaeon]|nr:MAG: hypothetical protein DRN75_01395 [Nanoarchaeota archaeon]HDO79763.1 S-methyl-5-thioribose-1-phosphate isomerase [Candidatus Aenigmarchaeota archaeon]HEX32815.1 S-methyl-5-thioribose-1-phosphate isomerase [Candidatus Aenigmarchaeota archaeon]